MPSKKKSTSKAPQKKKKRNHRTLLKQNLHFPLLKEKQRKEIMTV